MKRLTKEELEIKYSFLQKDYEDLKKQQEELEKRLYLKEQENKVLKEKHLPF